MCSDGAFDGLREETKRMERYLEILSCSERLTAVHVLLRGYIYGYIDQETCEEVLEQKWSTEEWTRIVDAVEGNFSNRIFDWVEDAARDLELFDEHDGDEDDDEEDDEEEDEEEDKD